MGEGDSPVSDALGFPAANGRQAILRSVDEALAQVERCAELVGDNQEVQLLLDSVGDKLRRTMRDLRQRLSPLGDVRLDGADLCGDLERMVAHARGVLDRPVEAFIDRSAAAALPRLQAGHVLHLVREALENAILHAGASRIALRVAVENGRLVVRLSDDGCGFPVRAPRPLSPGLTVMQQRAESIQGLLAIDSAPGAGTIVTLTVPVRQ